MKTKKTTIIFLAFIFILFSFSGLSIGKYKGDTIRIQFDDCMLEVSTTSFVKNTLAGANISERAASIKNLLETVAISIPGAEELVYIAISDVDGTQTLDFKNATFEKRNRTSKKVVFFEGKVLEKDFGNYIIELVDVDYTIKFYLQQLKDLEKFTEASFVSKIETAETHIPSGKKKINGWLSWNGKDNFDTQFVGESSPFSLDMLILEAGVGAGVIKNQWANDINFRVGFGFANKGLQRNLYYAEFKMYYDFSDTDNFFSINSFVSLGWEHNFSSNFEKEKWVGVSLGYLVDRKTDFFKENTWKLALRKRINPTVSVSPELYFNGFFNNVYPGVQIGINF